MLDPNTDTALNNHGSYTCLCAVNGMTIFAHHPVGYCLATFPKDVHGDVD